MPAAHRTIEKWSWLFSLGHFSFSIMTSVFVFHTWVESREADHEYQYFSTRALADKAHRRYQRRMLRHDFAVIAAHARHNGLMPYRLTNGSTEPMTYHQLLERQTEVESIDLPSDVMLDIEMDRYLPLLSCLATDPSLTLNNLDHEHLDFLFNWIIAGDIHYTEVFEQELDEELDHDETFASDNDSVNDVEM